MSTEKYHNCEEIIARVKIYLSVHTGKDLAKALGVSENAISTWKKRGTLDIGKILLKCEGINQEWLLTGKGRPAKSTANFGMETVSIANKNATSCRLIRVSLEIKLFLLFRKILI